MPDPTVDRVEYALAVWASSRSITSSTVRIRGSSVSPAPSQPATAPGSSVGHTFRDRHPLIVAIVDCRLLTRRLTRTEGELAPERPRMPSSDAK